MPPAFKFRRQKLLHHFFRYIQPDQSRADAQHIRIIMAARNDADNPSWHNAARICRWRFAAMLMPIPEPQIRMPLAFALLPIHSHARFA